MGQRDYRMILCRAMSALDQMDCIHYVDRTKVDEPRYGEEIAREDFIVCAFRGKRGECFREVGN